MGGVEILKHPRSIFFLVLTRISEAVASGRWLPTDMRRIQCARMWKMGGNCLFPGSAELRGLLTLGGPQLGRLFSGALLGAS